MDIDKLQQHNDLPAGSKHPVMVREVHYQGLQLLCACLAYS